MQSRVRKYLEYTLKNESNSEEDETHILNKLNKSLRNELLIESLGKIIKEIPFFKKNFSNSSIEQLVFALRKLRLSPEEFLYRVLFQENFFGFYSRIIKENVLDERSLFFIVKGNLEEVSNFKQSGPYLSLKKIEVNFFSLSLLN